MSKSSELKTIEGTWDQIASHAAEFNGHKLRLTILSEDGDRSMDDRTQALTEWLNMPRNYGDIIVDDTREGISGFDEDDR